jgi:hypothetical protein
MLSDVIKEIIEKYDKGAKVEITNKGKYTEIKVKSEKYCDKARIWISLHELFKDRNDVIIEVE